MKLLFVKSNKIGSRLIRWALKNDCSHFAVCFDEQANGSGIVFHTKSGGATLEWFGLFKREYTVVHGLSFKSPLTLQDEEQIYQGMLAQYSGTRYDYKALAFWVVRGFLWRFLGIGLPGKNGWAVSGFNLCTGLAEGVKWIERWSKDHKIDLEMIAPHELYDRLLATGYFVDEGPWCEVQNSP